ncbi:MAG: hypothetical protein IPI65_16430 [Bacteroidetes bacterium]|nr:hypothetical protein [Bacteroidota bacterium]
MYDDGTHQDGAANDGNYGIDIEILIGETDFYYFITATDVDGLSSNYPACASLYLPIGFTAPNLVINEFMAINTATLADEDGVYSDYIELFNRGNTDIYLGDKFFSGPFIELSEPSPGQNNEIIVPPVDSSYTESVIILGNPASDATIVVFGLTSLLLFNSTWLI